MGSQEPSPVRDRHLYERYLPEYKAWYDPRGYTYVHSDTLTLEGAQRIIPLHPAEAGPLKRARVWLCKRLLQFTPRMECVRDGEVVMAKLAPGRWRRVTIDYFHGMGGAGLPMMQTVEDERDFSTQQLVSLRPDHCISRRIARCQRRYRARVNLALRRFLEPLDAALTPAIGQLVWEFWRGGCTDIVACGRPMPLKVATRLLWPSIAARVCKNWNMDGYCRCGLCVPQWLRRGWNCPLKMPQIPNVSGRIIPRRFLLLYYNHFSLSPLSD